MTKLAVACFFVFALEAAGASELKLGQPAPRAVLPRPDAVRGKKVLVLGTAPKWLKDAAGPLADAGATVSVSSEIPVRGALLVDEAGYLRWKGEAPGSAAGSVALVKEWEDGKAIFRYRCARCHGEDGRDASYPGIVPLAGIGNRLTRVQIREKLRPAVVGPDYILVRGDPFTARQFAALLTFLAGL